MQVLPTVTLTVEPGVVVQFEHSGDDLMVSGTLQVSGTEIAPVVFQPLSGTVPGSWGRVALLAGSAGTLEHAVSVGYGHQWERWRLDISYQYSWGETNDVGRSKIVGLDYDYSSVSAEVHWLFVTLSYSF